MSRRMRPHWVPSPVVASRRRGAERRAATVARSLHRRLRFEPLEDRRLLAITVNTLVDEMDGSIVDGDTSLRDAIAAAPTGETIDFSVTGTIQLTSLGQLVIDKSLMIDGPGASVLTIRAFDPTPTMKNGDGSRVFFISDGSSTTQIDVAIAGLTLTGGDVNSTAGGGAINSTEKLSLTDSTITGNATTGNGGGIASQVGNYDYDGDLTVANCTITDNAASGGGGISSRGKLEIIDSTIKDNASVGGGGISTAGSLRLIGSTVSGNSTNYFGGGGIAGRGDIEVTRSVIHDNTATHPGYGRGGGIFHVDGDLVITDSTISSNTARLDGGGISHNYLGFAANADDMLRLTRSEVSNNKSLQGDGGGIDNRSGSTAIVDSTLSENTAPMGSGGGIAVGSSTAPPSTFTISGTTVRVNEAETGGGIYLRSGTVDISGSSIEGNSAQLEGGGVFGNVSLSNGIIYSNRAGTLGGGIYGFGDSTVISTTILDNDAVVGGGIYHTGMLDVVNSTIHRNGANNSGGLYLFNSTTTIRHSTITENFAGFGGGFSVIGGSVTLDHTIVATNNGRFGPDAAVLFGGVLNPRFSFIGLNQDTNLPESPLGMADANGNRIGGPMINGILDPNLAAIAHNGGPFPTLTQAPMASSAVINMGDPAAVAGVGGVPEFDQRGTGFSRVSNGRIDIGAFEVQMHPPAVFGDYNQAGVVDAADYVVWRKTLGSSGMVPYSGADGDGDGTVDQDDYGVWRSHFGQTAPAAITGDVFGVEVQAFHAEAQAVSRSAGLVADASSRHTTAEEFPFQSLAVREASVWAQPDGRPPARPRREAAALLAAASRRDDALVAWLAGRTQSDAPGLRDSDSLIDDGQIESSQGSLPNTVDAALENLGLELRKNLLVDRSNAVL